MQKWGSRRGLKRYRCEQKHNFSIDFRQKPKPFWLEYFAGVPFRTLASGREVSVGTAVRLLKEELAALPRNEDITKQYCTRWSGVVCVDGVYVKVKGMGVMVFLYATDYAKHDIPTGILDFAENGAAFLRLFTMLKDVGYPLRYVVADEAPALKGALYKVFPETEVQLCHVHVLRNIRAMIHLSETDAMLSPFYRDIKKLLDTEGEGRRRTIWQEMARAQTIRDGEWEVLKSIRSRWDDLFRYETARRAGFSCPNTNNLIEGYNNHFKSRVKSIKGFEMISSAEQFVNAWMIRRRFTPFRECGGHFKHLNGHTPFSQTRNPGLPYPDIQFQISPKIPTQE
ncbi:MAG: transposase [Patescibacteria group bacterium]|nr:transposase [Patescibacteria group bacterium]